MSRVENQKSMSATPAEVFAFLSERTNATKIVPHLERVWDINPSAADVGQTWRWQFRLLGLPFEGTAEMTEFEPGKRLQFRTVGKLKSTWTYSVAPSAEGCAVTISVEHDIPDSVLGKVADRVALSRLGESSSQKVLENLAAEFGGKK